MAATIFDSTVLIGYVEPADPHHARAKAALRATRGRGDELVIPTSVYAEILVGAFRGGADAVARVDEILGDFGFRLEPLTVAIARQAAFLRSQHRSLRLADAIVLATGDVLGATEVLTADARWSRYSARAERI